ncbi:hypothetical protein JXR93_08460 [bacterium]|nr:hypothetical protein [bacterium]
MLRLPPLFIGNTPEDISPQIGNYLVLLIEAGQASCGYFKDDELLAHKVFRGYMVRKKQGKAQITYLKQKGKSRAGSRIRLSETELFIQEIIQWVNSHIENENVKRIILSVSPYLWSLFYKGKDRFFFDQRDSRIITPGIYWNQAGYLQMCHLAKNLFYGELIDFTNQFGKGIEIYCAI